MKPTRELVNAFRSAANKLSADPDIWDWDRYESCNCGILAQELGLQEEILRKANGISDDWSEFGNLWYNFEGNWVNKYECPVTNIVIDKVINTLLKNGVEPTDLYDIENAVTDENGLSHTANVNTLINYFNETADKLESQLLNQSVVSKEEVSQQQTVSLTGV